MKTSKKLAVAALVAASATVLAACGSGSDDAGHMGSSDMNSSHMDSGTSSGADNAPVKKGAREIAIEGSSFKFDPKAVQLSAGEPVSIVLTSSDIEHDVTVEKSGHVVHVKAGKTASGGLQLDQPGTYKFWCSVPGHRSAGMTGTITVS